jgi:hypothetical protein
MKPKLEKDVFFQIILSCSKFSLHFPTDQCNFDYITKLKKKTMSHPNYLSFEKINNIGINNSPFYESC